MQNQYSSLFDGYLSDRFDQLGKALLEQRDCERRTAAALYCAVRGRIEEAQRILQGIEENCSTKTMEYEEAELLITARKKPAGDKGSSRLIDQFIQRFPKTGFVRLLKVEELMQKKKIDGARLLVHQILEDYPKAKWLNIFLVQLEVFSKNYAQAGAYADAMPSGISKSLNLFWSKFWYPRILLALFSLLVVVYALFIFLPTSAIYILLFLSITFAMYVQIKHKDRLTALWLFGFGVILFAWSLIFPV